MTLPVQIPIDRSVANGVATSFPFSYLVIDDDDINVYFDDALADPSLYSVAGIGSPSGGSVDFFVAPGSGVIVTRERNVALMRVQDYQNAGDFRADEIDADLNRLWMALQDRAAENQRSLHIGISDSTPYADLELPALAARANLFLAFDAQGRPIMSVGTGTDAGLRADLANVNTGAGRIGFDGGYLADFFRAKNQRVAGSLAALRLIDKTQFTRAFITGHATLNDGGGGHYYFDAADTTSADNNGSIVVAADGGRWKLIISGSDIAVEVFGARGDGVTDDRAAIQATMDYIASTGRAGIARLRARTYGIGAGLSQVRGVSLMGVGQGFTYAMTDDVDGAIIKWLGAGAGKMLMQRNRWIGTLAHIIFDGNDLATMGVEGIGVCNSFYVGVTVQRIAIGSYAWFLTTTGATHTNGSQWPSCALNTFQNCIIRDVAGIGMCWDGTTNGANATVGAITQNLLINCRFQGGHNSVGLVMNKCCDTNWSIGGEYTSVSGASGVGVVLNYSADNNETCGNEFVGGVIASSDGTGVCVDARNNVSFNTFRGVYMTYAGIRFNNSGGGKVKFEGCADLSGATYSAASSPVAGASPWTYINTNPYAEEFQFWGGTISAVARIRNGVSNGVGTNAACYMLQPGDGITITGTVMPNIMITPH